MNLIMTDTNLNDFPAAQEEAEKTLPNEETAEPVSEVTPEITQTPLQEASEEAAAPEQPLSDAAEPKKYQTKAEIIERLEQVNADVAAAKKQETDLLKQLFYKFHNSEVESQKAEFLAGGGNEEDFKPAEDPLEEQFKSLMSQIKEKRAALSQEEDKEREQNYKIKLSIIEELKELTESLDDPNKNFTEFKKLQQQWKEVTKIPQGKAKELWENYQIYVEKFYDLLKLNNEFRELDFKKNFELKNQIVEKAEQLTEAEDPVSAFYQLQKLHQEYRETGPVSRELREQMWNRLKAASNTINRRYQQHYEQVKEKEQENLDQKTVICEIVEGIDYEQLTSFKQWDNKTKEVIALQAKWKSIGYAPQKMNNKIFDRFRKACDAFFSKKAEYFKATKETFSDNLQKKIQLCEKAEALKDSKEWKKTAEEFANLQKEWKTIGPVAKKYSDQVWKRFISACDYFFDQKSKNVNSQRTQESENLNTKKSIIEQLKEIDALEEIGDAVDKVRDLMAEWTNTGHVPFREKDKLYEAYHNVVDSIQERIGRSGIRSKVNNFRNTISNLKESGSQLLSREHEKLVRAYENMLQELHTYENNMGFFNISSSRGSSLLDDLNKKIEKLRQDIKETKDRIDTLEKEMQEKEGGEA